MKYGWKRDLPDKRDLKYSGLAPENLPASYSLRPHCPAPYDQGALGSCTANAIADAMEITENITKRQSPYSPSRLFIYYNERYIEGTVNEDSGAMIRDGIKSLAKWGVCNEVIWPYDISRFTNRPSRQCYLDASGKRIHKYMRVAQDSNIIRGLLFRNAPVIIGFSVYESFESPAVEATGEVPMPDINNESLLGGHAVTIVGYDDATSRFTLINSWGSNWGDGGYFTLPYQYVADSDLASDFWTITLL